MRFSLDKVILGLAVFFFGIPQGFCVRSAYFAASATSNFTIDLTSFWANQDTISNGAYAFNVATFGCRIIIFNPSPTTQVIQNTSYVDQVLEFPTPNSSWSMGNQNPFFYNGTATVVSHTPIQASGGTVNVFTFTVGGANAPGGFPQTLNQNQGMVIENTVNLTKNMTYTSGWLSDPTAGMFPWAKLHHLCTGRIDVADQGAAGTAPGFVIASGEQDYLSSSYQNYPMMSGGVLRRGDSVAYRNPVGINWLFGAGTITSQLYITDHGYAADGTYYDDGPVTCGSWSPPCYRHWLYSAVTADGYCNASASVDYAVDNTNSRSSFMPAHLYKTPIFINSGGPL
jgi:hypothetical protein